MTSKIEPQNFLNNLERVIQFRSEIANYLNNIADTIKRAELEKEKSSGKLALDREIDDINKISKNLQTGVFRLLVLGDMKRGKSTFLNALIGENLLPSDVNPCTALLTILRYGTEKKVTIYFNDKTPPEQIEFKTFKDRYTIDPTEAKKLEQAKQLAFPNISHAIVEYPLTLLEKGIEIVDSPGLNDTEARNELSLGYINNCHAILFVLRASQPCTLGERRYLENYLKDRGLTIFFLINAWDQIKESLIDPDDIEELTEAEEKLRRVFQANLSEYCQVDGYDIYDERVFELSSIVALRRRIKNTNASLEGTGFSQFLAALNTFLTKERALFELRQARILSRQTRDRVSEAVERRISLLDGDLNALKRKINSVEPEFKKLNDICEQFKAEIRTVRDNKSKKIADSFKDYVMKLGDTFETDFLQYQPSLNFLDFLSSGKREAFERELKKAFEQYISDKLSQWSFTAEKEMESAFAQLSRSATNYGASYTKVTNSITEKLTGQTLPPVMNSSNEDSSPTWAKWAVGIFSLARGNIAGVALVGAGFDWKNILLNLTASVGIGGMITALTGIVLGPIGFAMLGLGIGLLQADEARKELVKVTKKELLRYLPQISQQHWQSIYDAIKECFEVYEREVTDRMNEDIQSRKSELNNLVEQKESFEIDQNTEFQRLKGLELDVKFNSDKIEDSYQNFLQTNN
jgi:replication fork clamp-binding protein CrfC